MMAIAGYASYSFSISTSERDTLKKKADALLNMSTLNDSQKNELENALNKLATTEKFGRFARNAKTELNEKLKTALAQDKGDLAAWEDRGERARDAIVSLKREKEALSEELKDQNIEVVRQISKLAMAVNKNPSEISFDDALQKLVLYKQALDALVENNMSTYNQLANLLGIPPSDALAAIMCGQPPQEAFSFGGAAAPPPAQPGYGEKPAAPQIPSGQPDYF